MPARTETSPPPSPPVPSAARPPAPPKWAAERFTDTLATPVSAVARALDGVAEVPVVGHVLRFFSSVWLGLVWLGLIGLYIAIGSGFSSVRAHFELTDMEFFNAWPMRVLLALMCVTLVFVTVRRVRLTLFKLGVWTVHVGILVLVLGCVLYFSQKFEGLTRVYLHKSVDTFFDGTERALYAYKMNADGTPGPEVMIPLPHMPLYHEYTRETNNPLNRGIPAGALAPLSPALADTPVTIVGYYPDARAVEDAWKPGPPTPDVRERAVGVALTAAGPADEADANWLVGTKPAARGLSFDVFTLEYLYHPKPEYLAALSTPFEGGLAVTVRVPKLNVTKTIPFDAAKPIKIEGTPYTITAKEPKGGISLLTPGYQNARSDGFLFEISRDGGGKTTTFDRHVLTRFPEVSNDFITVDGERQRKRGGLFDPDIDLVFHNATTDTVYVAEDAAGAFTLVHRLRGGKVETGPVALRVPTTLTFGQANKVSATLLLVGTTNNAVQTVRPLIVPDKQRGRKTSVGAWIESALIELQVGTGPAAQVTYVPFSPFASHLGPNGHRPTVVDVPGVGPIGFHLSTTRKPLPVSLRLDGFEFVTQPRTPIAGDYISHLTATTNYREMPPVETPLTARLNAPADVAGLSFFQAMWDGDPKAADANRYTVLGVGNRPGIRTMVAGCALMLLGIVYSFYVKPVLLEKKKAQLAAWGRRETP